MDQIAALAELFGELMSLPLPVFILLLAAWAAPVALAHELGHAATALEVTSGKVVTVVGREPGLVRVSTERFQLHLWPLPIGDARCTYEPATLLRPKAEAWIALAGPLSSLLCAAALALAAVALESPLLLAGALAAAFHFVFSALPLEYGRGLGDARVADSDGRVIWRVLTGGPPGFGRGEAQREPGVARWPFLAVLVLVVPLAFWAGLLVGLMVVGVFVVAFLIQRAEQGSG